MTRQRLEELGNKIQLLSCYTPKLVVITRAGKVRYIIYKNVMVDDPTKEMCFNALSKVRTLKVINLD